MAQAGNRLTASLVQKGMGPRTKFWVKLREKSVVGVLNEKSGFHYGDLCVCTPCEGPGWGLLMELPGDE